MSSYHQLPAAVQSDQDCVVRSLEDMALFQPLYDKYYESILGFIYLRVDSKEEAFDITQQVFLQAMSNLRKYSFRGLPFSSWLYRIAVHEIGNHFRRNRQRECINLEERHLKNVADELPDGEQDIKMEILAGCLQALGGKDFELIQMRFFERRSFAEIAEILGLTENHAKVKTYRLLEKLRVKLNRNR